MTQSNGRHGKSEVDGAEAMFGARVELERSEPMSGFARHEHSSTRRIDDIASTVRDWDWRARAAEGPSTSTVPPEPRSSSGAPVSPAQVPGPSGDSGQRPRIALLAAAAVVVIGAVVGLVIGLSGGNSPHTTPPAASGHSGSSTPTTTGSSSQTNNAGSSGHSAVANRFDAVEKTATQAGLAMAQGFANLKGVPTVTAVSAFTDIYATALTTYGQQLHAISFATAQRAASRNLEAEVATFVTFLHTIHTIPPAQLGAWINELYANVAQLTSATSELRSQLGLPLRPVV